MFAQFKTLTFNVQTNVRRQKVDLEFVPSFSKRLLETNDRRRSTMSPRKSRLLFSSTFCCPEIETQVPIFRHFFRRNSNWASALKGSGRRVRKVAAEAKWNRPISQFGWKWNRPTLELVRQEVSSSVSDLAFWGLWRRRRPSLIPMSSEFVASLRQSVSSTFLEAVSRGPKVFRKGNICPGKYKFIYYKITFLCDRNRT